MCKMNFYYQFDCLLELESTFYYSWTLDNIWKKIPLGHPLLKGRFLCRWLIAVSGIVVMKPEMSVKECEKGAL